MINIFVDTNILVDVFANRIPFIDSSLKIYNFGIQKKNNSLHIIEYDFNYSLYIKEINF